MAQVLKLHRVFNDTKVLRNEPGATLETTMNPINRILRRVTLDEVALVDQVFSMLMEMRYRQENTLFKRMRRALHWICSKII